MRTRVVAATAIAMLGSGPALADLITSYTLSGNVGAEVAAFPTAGSPGAGSLVLSGVPGGATIEQAYLYANNYFSAPLTSAVFAGNALGPVGAYASHGGAVTYRFDVTPFVTGNGSYAASYSGPNNTYGLTLAVVFSHASLPSNVVCINDGATDMGSTTTSSSTSCAGMAAGPGTLWIHTLADNALGESNDSILYNGVEVAAPIDANLGSFASLFNLAVTNLDGVNTATVVSPSDTFNWDLAVFAGAAGVTAVPVPGTLGLLGLGFLGLAAARIRRSL